MTKIIPNLDDSLFRIDLPTRSPSAGVLLVAEPFLREEYFNHAVITLVEHGAGNHPWGLCLTSPPATLWVKRLKG